MYLLWGFVIWFVNHWKGSMSDCLVFTEASQRRTGKETGMVMQNIKLNVIFKSYERMAVVTGMVTLLACTLE